MTAFVAILLLGLTVAFVAYPFFGKDGERPKKAVDKRALGELQAKRDALDSVIRDLRSDFEAGHLSKEELEALESSARKASLSIAKELGERTKTSSVEDEIERRVMKLRKGGDKGLASPCPKCGTQRKEGDRFCAKCGARLIEGGKNE